MINVDNGYGVVVVAQQKFAVEKQIHRNGVHLGCMFEQMVANKHCALGRAANGV